MASSNEPEEEADSLLRKRVTELQERNRQLQTMLEQKPEVDERRLQALLQQKLREQHELAHAEAPSHATEAEFRKKVRIAKSKLIRNRWSRILTPSSRALSRNSPSINTYNCFVQALERAR